MTMEKTIERETGANEDRGEMLADDAQKAFDRAVRIFEKSCDSFETSGEVTIAEVLKDVRAINAALQHTLEMREKAREAGSKRFGASGAGQLDLGAARSEIGLRLACLRDVRAGEDVSGEP